MSASRTITASLATIGGLLFLVMICLYFGVRSLDVRPKAIEIIKQAEGSDTQVTLDTFIPKRAEGNKVQYFGRATLKDATTSDSMRFTLDVTYPPFTNPFQSTKLHFEWLEEDAKHRMMLNGSEKTFRDALQKK